ncbi:MAG: hypothetical protein FJX74_22915, partial [Armatimonadetes bacterium]|nr:hypothetical protein [Armatimonadota bacterium]
MTPQPRARTTLCGLVLLAAGLAPDATAARLLEFGARAQTQGAVRVAEVTGGGQVLIRLRSKSGAVLGRAEDAARALQGAALAGAAAPALAVTPGSDGAAVLKAGTAVVVVADKETASLSSSTPAALAASWRSTLETAFREPYLVLADRSTVQAPVDEARYVRYGGPLAKALSAVSSDESIVAVATESGLRRLKLYGMSPGDTTVRLTAGSLAVGLPVEVRHWAAKIPGSAVAELTGSGQDERIARKVAVNAALAAAVPRPGATVSALSTDREGSRFRIGVVADGEGYFGAKKQVEVQLKWVLPPDQEPVDLFISNAPERIQSIGSLMREQLVAGRPARMLYHHVNSTGQTILFVARIANVGAESAAVHVVLGESGPGTDELAVGHAAAVRFWDQTRTGSGYVLRVPPMVASDIVRVPVSRDAIVSGLARLTPLSGPPLLLEVMAVPVHHEAQWVEPLAEDHYAAPKLTAFGFGARKVTSLKHEIGGPWAFFSLGREGSTNAAGTYLAGDYGVLHEIDVEVTNPHDTEGWVALDVRAGGGVMRGLFAVDGTLHETGMLVGSQQERVCRI